MLYGLNCSNLKRLWTQWQLWVVGVSTVRSRRLRFFGHICRAYPSQDHSRALYASTTGLPKHWRRRPGRPIETDLVTNYREWSTATQSRSGDSWTACSEQNSLADIRGNGYVADNLRLMMMIGQIVSRVY